MKRATRPVRASMRRPDFDAGAEFVANGPRRISGVQLADGEGIDKSAITPRRLEQMFDARHIRYAEGHVEAKPLPKPVAIGPTDLFNPGVCGQPRPEAGAPKGHRVQRVRSRRAA